MKVVFFQKFSTKQMLALVAHEHQTRYSCTNKLVSVVCIILEVQN
jgi:hypothetical protein